ncbi:TauD/TfdA dioxygenase family protein [Nocardia sp. NBC_01327]|uniref:TauD/TfdA dioxygenase family protein n=1 Tax=Nocardia sp. NBC_01327 TaxID=2903593 RepID=UPI002E0DBF66|nr:TauD/TfdA family dioxygenase [Nocardia sp. NBC_01327]
METTTKNSAVRTGANQSMRLDGYPLIVGPFTHVAAERDRLSALRWQHFDAKQLGASIGAELSGVDLTAELADEVVAEIRQALHEYKVVFFRDQPMTPAQHVAFAQRFGELEIHPFIPSSTTEPELVRFEKSAEVAGFENSWHHDVTWRAQPSMGAVLHGVSIPPLGGDTLFADMYAAYESLDDDTKALIENLEAVHDYTQAFGRFVPDDQRAQMRERFPAVNHPVVCTHAATGRRHLYVNRIFVSHIDGMDLDQSRALIDRLCRQADAPEHQCRFQWEPDSVAFWDNRAVQHYAASDYWPAIRIMERASIIGPRPAR